MANLNGTAAAAILLLLAGSALAEQQKIAVAFQPARPVKGDITVVNVAPCVPSGKYSLVLKTSGRPVFPVPEISRGKGLGFAVFPLESGNSVSYELLENGKSVLTGTIGLTPSPAQTEGTQKLTLDNRYVEPPASLLERIQREAAILKRARTFYTNARFFRRSPVFPVERGRLGSRFGEQRLLNGSRGSIHYGVDIRSNVNKAVVSMYPGKVVLTADTYYSGRTVIVAHGYGLVSQYLHLAEIHVKPGDFVRAGQDLGKMGMTGRATGPHLHLSCYLMSVPFNALSCYSNLKYLK